MWCLERKSLRLRPRVRSTRAALAALVACVLYSGWTAADDAAPSLKVSGRAAFDVEARSAPSGYELRLLLADEVGRPLGGAEVSVRAEGDGLPTLRRCGDTRAEAAGELVLTTDAAGRLCVSVTGMTTGNVILGYRDARGYFERTSHSVRLPERTTSSFEVGFDPPLTSISLDKPVQELGLVARSRNGTPAPDGAELAISLITSAREVELGRSALDGLGEVQRFAILAASFGEPGPARLVARLRARSGDDLSRASVGVLRTATVSLRLDDAVSSVEVGSALKVQAVSALGPAPGGVVEARSGGFSVAAAPVHAGVAQLALPSAPGTPWSSTITLEYIGHGPGWIGGTPLEVRVLPEGPSYGRYALWIGAAVLAALAVVLGWRRPARPRPVVGALPPRPRASVEVLEAFPSGAGYRGGVRDAHEGTPVSPAVLSFIGPGSPGPVLQQIRVGAEGQFELEGSTFPPGTSVEVTAPFHATLRAELPPPGVLELSLITRRRALLERLVRWAEKRGKPWTRAAGEPTPAHVVAAARSEAEPEVERWARGMERLAFGPVAPDAASELAAGVAEDPKLGGESPRGID